MQVRTYMLNIIGLKRNITIRRTEDVDSSSSFETWSMRIGVIEGILRRKIMSEDACSY